MAAANAPSTGLVPDGDEYEGKSLRVVADELGLSLPSYYHRDAGNFHLVDLAKTKTLSAPMPDEQDTNYAQYGIFVVLKPTQRNVLADAATYVGFETIDEFRAFCNTHAATILGPVYWYIRQDRAAKQDKKGKKQTAVRLTSWELKTIYRHLNFLREPVHKETLEALVNPQAVIPFPREENGFLLTFLGSLLRLCRAYPQVFRERPVADHHPVGSRFVAGVSMEDLARAQLVWVHYCRMRKAKKYFLKSSPGSAKRLQIQLPYTESSSAARARRRAADYQDPLLWKVWHTPKTPTGMYLPPGVHQWARQFVHDWYFQQPSQEPCIAWGPGPSISHVLMVNNYDLLRQLLPALNPGVTHTRPGRGPWVSLDDVGKFRNGLLRRGQTNPFNEGQVFRDLDDNEMTASYFLDALDLLVPSSTGQLKVFDHFLPWPVDIREQYGHLLETARQAAIAADPQTRSIVNNSLLPAASIWTRLPSLLTPEADRAGLSLLTDEVQHALRTGQPPFAIEDSGATWLYNMTTLDDAVMPQTRPAMINYLLGKSPCLAYALGVAVSVLFQDETNHLLIIAQNDTIFHVVAMLLEILGVSYVLYRHDMDQQDRIAVQDAWNNKEEARLCLALRSPPPSHLIDPRRINHGVHIGGPMSLRQMVDVISSTYNERTETTVTWHFFKARGTYLDGEIGCKARLMIEESGITSQTAILERLDMMRLALRQSFNVFPFAYLPIPPSQGGGDDVAYVGYRVPHILRLVSDQLIGQDLIDAATSTQISTAAYLLGRLGVGKALGLVDGVYDRIFKPSTLKLLAEEERPSAWLWTALTGEAVDEEKERRGALLFPGFRGDDVADLKRLVGVTGDDPTANIAGMVGPGAQYPTFSPPKPERIWRHHASTSNHPEGGDVDMEEGADLEESEEESEEEEESDDCESDEDMADLVNADDEIVNLLNADEEMPDAPAHNQDGDNDKSSSSSLSDVDPEVIEEFDGEGVTVGSSSMPKKRKATDEGESGAAVASKRGRGGGAVGWVRRSTRARGGDGSPQT